MRRPAAVAPDARRAADRTASRWRRWQLVVLLAITALAAAVRVFRLELWSWSAAEAGTYAVVTAPQFGPDRWWSDGGGAPLVHAFLRALIGFVPSLGEGWLRLPFAFVGALSVPLLALAARRWCRNGAALVAAACLALHPLHVAHSQTAAPAAMAAAALVLVLGLAVRGHRWAAWVALVLGGFVHAVVWLVGVAWLLPLAVRPRAGGAVRLPMLATLVLVFASAIGAFGGALDAAFGGLSLPFVAVAALGACGSPALSRTLVWPLAVGCGGSLYAAIAGADPAPWQLSLLLPLALASARGVVHAWHELRRALARVWRARPRTGGAVAGKAVPGSALIGVPFVRGALAAAPAVLVVAELAVGTFGYLTVHRGGRPPWRDAAQAVLTRVPADRGLDVVAADGAEVLTVYLRPSHWAEPERDPHPRRRIEPLARDAAAAAAQLDQRSGARTVLVLAADEMARLAAEPATAAALRGFARMAVFPAPAPHGDRTVHVLVGR